MQVKEISKDGLSRALQITIPIGTLAEKLEARLSEAQGSATLKGFRPGKVPMAHLRKTYGQQFMGEIVQTMVTESSQETLAKRDERPALQPEIKIVGEIEAVLQASADLVFDMSFEIIPSIKLMDFSKIKITRPVVAIDDSRIDEGLERLAESRQSFAPRDAAAKAQKGDQVKIDFIGRIDGEAFEGGTAENFNVILGSNSFIPGFEDGLVGVKAGDSRDIAAVFPDDYGNAAVAGKKAVFEVKVHEVAASEKTKIDDEFATGFGLADLAELRVRIGEQMGNEYGQFSRGHLKKALLDELESAHEFELPPAMVSMEFDQIWQQYEQETTQDESLGKGLDEKAMRKEYEKIAARRVRTGLVLAEIGNVNEITISDEELNRGLMARVQDYPGQEQQVLEYFQKNPEAMAQIRAPLMEEKIIDFISEMAEITDKPVSVDELTTHPDPTPLEAVKQEKAEKKPKPKSKSQSKSQSQSKSKK